MGKYTHAPTGSGAVKINTKIPTKNHTSLTTNQSNALPLLHSNDKFYDYDSTPFERQVGWNEAGQSSLRSVSASS